MRRKTSTKWVDGRWSSVVGASATRILKACSPHDRRHTTAERRLYFTLTKSNGTTMSFPAFVFVHVAVKWFASLNAKLTALMCMASFDGRLSMLTWENDRFWAPLAATMCGWLWVLQ